LIEVKEQQAVINDSAWEPVFPGASMTVADALKKLPIMVMRYDGLRPCCGGRVSALRVDARPTTSEAVL
jgi:hypothetical protein